MLGTTRYIAAHSVRSSMSTGYPIPDLFVNHFYDSGLCALYELCRVTLSPHRPTAAHNSHAAHSFYGRVGPGFQSLPDT